MNLADFIGETTEYDKKEKLEERKPKSWLKSVSAFANGIGGVLLFGISDDDVLIGLDDAKDASEKISEAIKTKMDPIPETIMEVHRTGDKEFIILKVLSGIETPYYYIGDGNRIAFVRVGNASIPADSTVLKRLVIKGSNYTFDSLSTQYKFTEFAFTKFKSVYRQRTNNELNSNDFISFGLVNERGMLTNAGALLADECPLRNSRLFCTRWYGVDKASGIMDALDDKEYSGSLITLLQAAEEFINNNTKKPWKKIDNGRIEMPDYPERAVLECIVNSLIHRDYLILGSEVHIDIFDDRIEITSPGGMLDGSEVQKMNIDNITSKRRNPIIADVFSRIKYMERRGSGFRKIKNDYLSSANYRPEFEPKFYSDISTFKVTLYNLNYSIDDENVLIDTKKVVFDDENALIDTEKVAIEKVIDNLKVNKNTKEKVKIIFQTMQFDNIFGRKNIMEITKESATSAGNLITNLKKANLIVAVQGYGKGKYKFNKQ